MKVVAVLASPAPYTTPVLNALAGRVDVHTVYLAADDRVSRFADSWGAEPAFEYSVHHSRAIDVPSIDLHVELALGVARELGRLGPDAILLVSWKPTVLEPLLWSRWSGAAAVMWAESTPFSGLLRDPASTSLRKLVVRSFDAYVSNGSQASLYLRELGVPSERIVTSLLPAARAADNTERNRPPSDRGVHFLFVGRLIAQKRPLELIAAFAAASEALPGATLTVVGRGELEDEVREAASRTPAVRYAGYHEGQRLASFYAESDVLVLPALREVWGVVVNEALAHGLFVVTTDQVGSAFDLLDEKTGVVLPADDLDRLAPALIEVGCALDIEDDARRGRASVTAACTPERFAEDISKAVDVAVRVRATRPRRARNG